MIKNQKLTTKLFFENAKKDTKIPFERLTLLNNIANKITLELKDRNKVNLNFICSHNSRRSQMGQAWSFYATEYFKIDNIFSFSGGIKTTSFHRNAVKTLQESGFKFNIIDFSHQNPKYLISFKETEKNILGFSKRFDNKENNPPYIAIITCDHTDKNPFSLDALSCFHLPYNDPKTSDNTPYQKNKHQEINTQIAAEMYILFEKVATSLKTINLPYNN